MGDDRYSVLRTNGVLFLTGVLLMGMLAALGGLMGPPPAVVVATAVAADSVDLEVLVQGSAGHR